MTATKHKMVVDLAHGPSDIGAEITCEITFNYLPGAAPIINPADNADPGWPAEIEFVGVVPLSNGKPYAYEGVYADLMQGSLDSLAEDWLASDEGQAEAFAIATEDSEPDPDAERDAEIDDAITDSHLSERWA